MHPLDPTGVGGFQSWTDLCLDCDVPTVFRPGFFSLVVPPQRLFRTRPHWYFHVVRRGSFWERALPRSRPNPGLPSVLILHRFRFFVRFGSGLALTLVPSRLSSSLELTRYDGQFFTSEHAVANPGKCCCQRLPGMLQKIGFLKQPRGLLPTPTERR